MSIPGSFVNTPAGPSVDECARNAAFSMEAALMDHIRAGNPERATGIEPAAFSLGSLGGPLVWIMILVLSDERNVP